MIKIFKVAKNEINLPIIVIIVGFLIFIYHIFSYLVPFTSHAFIVTNVTPIAADVSGFITKIYVKNGSVVSKGSPLFDVYQKPYELAYQNLTAKYQESIVEYEKAKFQYDLKSAISVEDAVSVLEIKNLKYNLGKKENKMNALKAKMNNAQVNLDLTVVTAPSDGVVDNLYIGEGTPIKIHEPLFSFIDTSTWWVQANFNETDLRNVRPGDEVYIMLRMYYFDRIFHGKVVNTMWAAERKTTSARSQQQRISSDNQWLLEPQRFPIQIEILDPDANIHSILVLALMYISKLNSMVESYDPYGEHRVNGIKAVYILLIMFSVNMIFTIPNPYFYYFYVPMTALTTEVAGYTINGKFLILFQTLLISALTVFLFTYYSPYWFLFIFVLLYSICFYFIGIDNQKFIVLIVPVSLALGAYSLLYENINTSFYDILNNCITILIAMGVMFAALATFPRGYYYRIWLRTLVLSTDQMIQHLSAMLHNQSIPFDPVEGYPSRLDYYANILPRSRPLHSVLKINLLMNELHMIVMVAEKNAIYIDPEVLKLNIRELSILKSSIENQQLCDPALMTIPQLKEIIKSWNYLCLKK